MKAPVNIDESLPIELLQKDFIITEEEIKTHATLRLTVIKSYIILFNPLFRKPKEIYFPKKRLK